MWKISNEKQRYTNNTENNYKRKRSFLKRSTSLTANVKLSRDANKSPIEHSSAIKALLMNVKASDPWLEINQTDTEGIWYNVMNNLCKHSPWLQAENLVLEQTNMHLLEYMYHIQTDDRRQYLSTNRTF